MTLTHLGWSGILVEIAGLPLCVDPPSPTDLPTVLTWSEQERTLGARSPLHTGPLAADAPLLSWLGKGGAPFPPPEARVAWCGVEVQARPYTPIPYATWAEALRKTRSALHHPALASQRLAYTLRRPASPPFTLVLSRHGARVAILGQALHRFVTAAEIAALAAWVGEVDVVIAGPDYDDEAATGALLGRFAAQQRVIYDGTGSIRRRLGLPVRPLSVALDAAPPGTTLLTAP